MTVVTDQKGVEKEVAKELKRYRALQVSQLNRIEQENEGMIDSLFTSLDGSKVKENDLKAKQIARALENALDETERYIIENKFLKGINIKDITLYTDMGLNKDQYYIIKRSAINQIATALRII
ncbi:ArpU family transcriptional regulator [Fictibacillus sp. 5RED26]|uniref:ArpU family phage packaging/lysis transcriptional regulator n=1 Tax=Fictibacillus sp. 5RED26 TaxID=2745876 RepID=UPI0018CF3F82|nr:ArpU family phage packaging/lysis transcriptional regulator [Fictibacillus sp. 5RED26]MBH0159075.1 ArpU family transcriptional regulator [Fictibacillus sp. 5RED26]